MKAIIKYPGSKWSIANWIINKCKGLIIAKTGFGKTRIAMIAIKKFLKKNPYEIRFNTNFEEVIRACASVKRSDNQGTWITEDIIKGYINLHKKGYAYSVETYLDNKLVGGVYGVSINMFYSGESMFHIEDNASKVALVALLYRLHSQGIGWLDTQMVTPVVESLGGVEIPRETYLAMLERSLYK